jgi:hypothetical protein
MTPLMTFDETAAVLRITPESLRSLVKNRRAPKSYRVGKRRMFAPVDVQAWLDAHATEPRSAA